MQDPVEEAIEVGAVDIVAKVVASVGGDLDRVRMIARAQIIAGRALNRLAFMAQSERMEVNRVAIAAIVSDVVREERAQADEAAA